MWLPGRPERKQLAREALSDVLDHWLNAGAAYLMIEAAGRSTHPPAQAKPWSTILYALADAATAIGRYSRLARTIAPADEQELQALAPRSQTGSPDSPRRSLGQPIDRDAVLAEATAFLQEVDHKEGGLKGQACVVLFARVPLAGTKLSVPRISGHTTICAARPP